MSTADKVLAALSAYDLKDNRGGKWRCNSPFRPGSNSHAFTLLITSAEHGTFHDKVSGEFGSLYTLAEKLNIDVPRQQATETKRSYDTLDDYAAAHGVPVEAFLKAGWLAEKSTHWCIEHKKERPCFVFKTATGNRYRFTDGLRPAYTNDGGYKNCWYGLKHAPQLANTNHLPLILCNGAPSVIAAQYHGIPAVALAGGGGRIPPELLAELRSLWTGAIILALDCDEEGQRSTKAYHEQLPTAAIVELGLTTGGDLADFCHLFGDNSGQELLSRAVHFDTYEEALDLKDLSKTLTDLLSVRKGENKNGATLDEVLDKAQREIDILRQKSQPDMLLAFSDLAAVTYSQIVENSQGNDSGLTTYMPAVDDMVGRWQGGRVHMIYGDTNMGKSTLAVSIVGAFIKLHGSGLIVPTESPPVAYMMKLVAFLAQIPYDRVRRGSLSEAEWKTVKHWLKWLEKMNCHILHAGSPTPAAVGAALREGMRKYGYKWCLVDSISKMKVSGVDTIYDTTRLASDAIQDMTLETGVTMLATCQVGRNLKDRAVKTPMPNDALGAGTVEQNADVILSLYNHDHYVKLGMLDPDPNLPAGTAMLKCIKHRWEDSVGNGVKLRFVGGAGLYEAGDSGDVEL